MVRLHERIFLFALQKLLSDRPRIARALLRCAGSAAAVFDGDRARWRKLFGGDEMLWTSFLRFGAWEALRREWEALPARGIRALALSDATYPARLRAIYDPPPMLFARGDADLLLRVQVAIVGSRKASDHGKRTAAVIAEELVAHGVVVTSGMAFGVDAAAHRGALGGGGETIAVLGSGVDRLSPATHYQLAGQILERGLILSEFPPGAPPYPAHFPQRNRVISGLSVATVIVEAAHGSGSLITARLALEQGRDVFACPGRAGDPLAHGTHALLRDGAALVESGRDVLELIAGHLPRAAPTKSAGHFEGDVGKDTGLFDLLRERGAMGVDDIVAAAGCAAPAVLAGLTALVVDGRVEELPGRRFRRKGCY